MSTIIEHDVKAMLPRIIGEHAKVYMRYRSPIIGRFVCLEDDSYLSLKGMKRFVTDGRLEKFNERPCDTNTIILVVSEIESIKTV